MASASQLPRESTPKRIGRFLRKVFYRRPPTYEAPYCNNLIAIFHGQVLQEDAIRSRVEELKALEKTPDVACELELLNLRVTDPNGLPKIVAQLRQRWSSLSGDPINQQEPAANDRAGLLAEASMLIAQIHRQYTLQQTFDAQKRWILFWMFFWFIIAAGVLGYLTVRLRFHQGILFEEMLAGIIGGYTSTFMRVYKMEGGKDLVAGIQGVRFGVTSLIVKPALGGIFAIMLHLLFISKTFSGGAFPSLSIACTGDKPVHFSEFFTGIVEATSVDFAKLLIWCFIAGFAERLVPDVLDSMANKASKTAVVRK